MQTFKINRNSWHYRMNKQFFNDNEHSMHFWERKHTNFCSYWRATVLRLVWLCFLTAVLLGMAIMMVVAVVSNPVAAGFSVLFIVGLIAVCIGIALLHERLSSIQANNPEPKTLVGKQYAAYKSKICPSVEFDE